MSAKRRAGGLRVVLAAALLAPAAASAAGFDAALYARLLERYTAEVPDPAGVRVDYAGLLREPEWQQLVASLAAADPAGLAGRAERLAFWINAYNVLAIELVIRHYPVESIRDIGSLLRPVWRRRAGAVGGRPTSLGEIEHEILRPLGEPRIHAALVCASVSCPSLRREPYRAARLEAQLADALRRWLADPVKGARLDREAGVLYLSRVFDWFRDDFAELPGALEPWLPEPTAAWLRERGGAARLRYLDYDWRLNDLARR